MRATSRSSASRPGSEHALAARLSARGRALPQGDRRKRRVLADAALARRRGGLRCCVRERRRVCEPDGCVPAQPVGRAAARRPDSGERGAAVDGFVMPMSVGTALSTGQFNRVHAGLACIRNERPVRVAAAAEAGDRLDVRRRPQVLALDADESVNSARLRRARALCRRDYNEPRYCWCRPSMRDTWPPLNVVMQASSV